MITSIIYDFSAILPESLCYKIRLDTLVQEVTMPSYSLRPNTLGKKNNDAPEHSGVDQIQTTKPMASKTSPNMSQC